MMLHTNNGTNSILFTPRVIKTFTNFRQILPESKEAGGFLIGQKFGNQIVVEYATTPNKKDIRKRFFIKRDKKLGQKIIDAIWKKSKGEMIFIGEWHTHPEPFPTPSSIDIKEASRAIKKHKLHLDFMVIVIVSNEAIVNSWIGVQTKFGLYRLKRAGYQLWRDNIN